MRKLLLAGVSLFAFTGLVNADPITVAVASTAQVTALAGGVSSVTFGSAGSIFYAQGLSAVASHFAVRAALGYALNALSTRSTDNLNSGAGVRVNNLSGNGVHQVLYGESHVGGEVFYQAVTSSTGGGGNTDRLHRLIAYAGHEIDSYQAIYVNGEEITKDSDGIVTAPSAYANKIRIKEYLGTEDQEADEDLRLEVSEWSSAGKASGIAYLYVRFEDSASFPDGIPVVSARIRGKKVTEIRETVLEGTPTDTYSDGDTVPVASYSSTSDFFFAVDCNIPESPSGTILEIGGTSVGMYCGFDGSGNLILRGGTGSVSPTANTAIVTVDPADFESILGVDITLYGEFDYSADKATLWWGLRDESSVVKLGENVASGGFPGTGWTGTSNGAVGQILGAAAGGFTGNFNGTISEARLYTSTEAPIENNRVVFSSNPAMCIRDYLLSDYGLSDTTSSINDTLFESAADKCDGLILGKRTYTCNGSFLLDGSPENIIRSLLSSMGGTFWNFAGQWAVLPAEYRTPTVTLTEDDLRGNLEIATRHSRRDNFNTVVGQYKGSETLDVTTNYPKITSGFYLEEDNNVEFSSELNLLFTEDFITAKRIAQTYLRRNRNQITVSGSFGLNALDVKIGDNVMLTVDHLGFSSKVFEVVDWRLSMRDYDIQVDMILREMSETVFTGVEGNLTDESDNILTDESDNNLTGIFA